ncbi:hypothetical protein [Kitasatospora sp. DSM 101779]|uniref:hypothetical protein n=1 Tax=Kitasatospora sp. DSM 101779 TaxID=2853165 RepID=UPI0021DB7935|nr:hypothetical protein [Kitasatospora sp. DSM 101779]MCU7823784.1 hypothetical protein [Kitasatospora sp. DSM 101779]
MRAVAGRRAAAAAVVLLALAGCGGGGGGTAAPALTPPALGAPTAPPTGREGMLALPLSAYGSDREQNARREQAVRALTADCMHAAGWADFTRDDAVDSGGEVPDASALPAGAFGYLRAEVAAVQGFHGPSAAAPVRTPRPPASEAEGAAAQECVKKALAAVRPADSAGSELVAALFGRSLEATGRDARVVAATRVWSACIRTRASPTPPRTAWSPATTAPAGRPPRNWPRPPRTSAAPRPATWPGSGSRCWPATSGS